MRNHMLSIVPLIAGIILTIIGSLANNMVITIIGLMIVFWGLIIHSNNIKIIRNCRMNSSWKRNKS